MLSTSEHAAFVPNFYSTLPFYCTLLYLYLDSLVVFNTIVSVAPPPPPEYIVSCLYLHTLLYLYSVFSHVRTHSEARLRWNLQVPTLFSPGLQ